MNKTTTGLVSGLALGLGAATGGFWGFLITAVLGAIGLGVGAFLEGRLDLSHLGQSSGRRRV
jgi:hypothetical protein